MAKQLKNIRTTTESCWGCPHYSDPQALPNAVAFTCKASPDERKLIPDSRPNVRFIHDDCPLPDARGQGVLVGVSLILLNEKNQILVGHRNNASSGNNSWGLPGGGMDAGEKPKETGIREVREETSLRVADIDALEFANFTNDSFMEESGEHWITLYYLCRFNNWEGLPKRVEPHKCKEWRWCDLDNLPQPIFCDWDKNIEFLKAMI